MLGHNITSYPQYILGIYNIRITYTTLKYYESIYLRLSNDFFPQVETNAPHVCLHLNGLRINHLHHVTKIYHCYSSLVLEVLLEYLLNRNI